MFTNVSISSRAYNAYVSGHRTQFASLQNERDKKKKKNRKYEIAQWAATPENKTFAPTLSSIILMKCARDKRGTFLPNISSSASRGARHTRDALSIARDNCNLPLLYRLHVATVAGPPRPGPDRIKTSDSQAGRQRIPISDARRRARDEGFEWPAL